MQSGLERDANTLALYYLQKYHAEIQRQKSENVSSALNWCSQRAERLRADLQNIGITSVVITVTGYMLTHECGGRFDFHNVVLDEKFFVYDPNYTGAVPIPFEEYIQTVFLLPTDIYLWENLREKGTSSGPIARYTDRLLLERHPFPANYLN